MFGIGPLELFAIAAVALVVLGPRRLPEVAKQVGRFMAEVRRTTYDLRTTLDAELHAEDRDRRREEAEERRRKFREERDEAKASGEWPPGGQQDTTDRPQPTVDALSDPAEQPYDSLKAAVEPGAEATTDPGSAAPAPPAAEPAKPAPDAPAAEDPAPAPEAPASDGPAP